jgi:hypothetical protein
MRCASTPECRSGVSRGFALSLTPSYPGIASVPVIQKLLSYYLPQISKSAKVSKSVDVRG